MSTPVDRLLTTCIYGFMYPYIHISMLNTVGRTSSSWVQFDFPASPRLTRPDPADPLRGLPDPQTINLCPVQPSHQPPLQCKYEQLRRCPLLNISDNELLPGCSLLLTFPSPSLLPSSINLFLRGSSEIQCPDLQPSIAFQFT